MGQLHVMISSEIDIQSSILLKKSVDQCCFLARQTLRLQKGTEKDVKRRTMEIPKSVLIGGLLESP